MFSGWQTSAHPQPASMLLAPHTLPSICDSCFLASIPSSDGKLHGVGVVPQNSAVPTLGELAESGACLAASVPYYPVVYQAGALKPVALALLSAHLPTASSP